MQAHLTRYATGVGSGAAAALLFLAAMRGAPLGRRARLSRPAADHDRDARLGLRRRPGGAVLRLRPGGGWRAGATRIVYGLLIAAPAWALAAFAGAPAFYVRKSADPAAPRPYPGPGAIAVLAAAMFIVAGAARAFADVGRQRRLRRRGRGAFGTKSATRSTPAAPTRALPPDMNADDTRAGDRSVRADGAVDRRDDHATRQSLSRGALGAALAAAHPAVARHSDRLRAAALAGGSGRRGGWRWRWRRRRPPTATACVVAGALGALYALQGLATLHALSRRAAARPFMLAALYFACAVASAVGAAGARRARHRRKFRRSTRPRRAKPENPTLRQGDENMEVILLERVAKLGHMGDTVRVKDGYARNFLLPRHKALRATEANKKKFEEQRHELEARNATIEVGRRRALGQARRPVLRHHPPGRRNRPALRLGVGARHRRRRSRRRRSSRSTATMSRSISRSRTSACTRSPCTCTPRSRRM